jgi:hypothetical protein
MGEFHVPATFIYKSTEVKKSCKESTPWNDLFKHHKSRRDGQLKKLLVPLAPEEEDTAIYERLGTMFPLTCAGAPPLNK